MWTHIKLTHTLKTQGGSVSKTADFPSTNKEHLSLLSVLIETNGCVDMGEKLGVKKITAFKSQGTSMIDYSSTVHYCHIYLFPISVATDNQDVFLFRNTASVRAKNDPLIAEYELLKAGIHIKSNAMNWNRLEYF